MTKIFVYHKPVLLFFRNEGANQDFEKILVGIKPELESKDIFINSVPEDGPQVSHFQNLIGVKPKDYPSLWILDLGRENTKGIQKYRFTNTFTRENVLEFINQWENKQIMPEIQSEIVTRMSSAHVITANTDTFE